MQYDTKEVVYQIDRNDCLVQFNDQWDRFAANNDSPHLVGEKISKLPLWNFICDTAIT